MILESIGLSKRERLASVRGQGVSEEDIVPALRDDAAYTSNFKKTFRKPAPEDAAQAKALINFLMQDRLFLALFRSTDPKERAAAMDQLNEAHHQAYGDAPAQGDDAAGKRQ